MKAKTFENLIRKVVREEIDYALRREIKSLKEDLSEKVKPIIEEKQFSPLPENVKDSLKEKIMGKKPIIEKQNLNFSQNPTLNDLLNETARGDTLLETENMSPASLSEPFSSGAPMPTDTRGMPSEVASAVTRDYSDLMKAIDKKKNKN